MVAAAVVPAPGADPTEDGLRAALRDRLSSFKIPRRIVFITDDDVPLTTTGKVRLFDLAELIASRIAPSATHRQKRARMTENDQRPSAEEIVLYEKDPATKIATITLDRADELNAMTIDAQHRYADLVRQANIDDDVKVLVIRANGPNLGSGADLPELMDIMAGRSDVSMNAHRARSPRTPTSSTRRRGRTATARPTCSSTPTPRRGCAACRTSRRSASSRSAATATAGTSTKRPTPTSSSPPRARCSATPPSATPAGPPGSGSGAR